jgi:hypothetical protein
MGAEMSSEGSADASSSSIQNLTEFRRQRVKSVHSLVIVRRPKASGIDGHVAIRTGGIQKKGKKKKINKTPVRVVRSNSPGRRSIQTTSS